MNGHRKNKAAHYVFAIAFGVLGASAVWYWGVPGPNVLNPRFAEDHPADSDDSNAPMEELAVWNPVAESYIRALLEGRCDDVIAVTAWMQERLDYMRLTGGESGSETDARADLCASISERRPDGNQLTSEGIADQYLFAPGVEYELDAADGGRDDLSKPALARNWVWLRFPSGYRAPKDRDGVPIRTMRVGVNVSTDGMVLKAGVRGTSEIDWESITTGWTK